VIEDMPFSDGNAARVREKGVTQSQRGQFNRERKTYNRRISRMKKIAGQKGLDCIQSERPQKRGWY